MRKAVRWKIPFQSISGEEYVVNIYDEVDATVWDSSKPITLTAGPTPFVTTEDASDDFFTPVRTQSGTLSICTKIEPQTNLISGGTIKLEDILPANNISRPIKLLKKTGPNTNVIKWQGFLSCEAYNQDYVGIPQILDLSIISVLEAMDSVFVKQATTYGLQTLNVVVYQALNEIEVESGVIFWDIIYYSAQSYQIFNKMLDTSILYKEEAEDSNYGTSYSVSGDSCKKVLEKICKFMGWIARENEANIYFERIRERIGMYYETMGGFRYYFHQYASLVSNTSANLSGLTWKGTGHQQSVYQGARLIRIVSKIETSSFSLKLPDFPFGNTSNLEWNHTTKYKSNTYKFFYIMINYNSAAYNNNEYGYYSGELTRTGDYDYSTHYIGESNQTDFIASLSLFPQPNANSRYISQNPLIAGAILIRYAIQDEQTDTHDLKTGLYCPLLPGEYDRDLPIFKMWTPKSHTFYNGHFHIKAEMLFNALYRYNSFNQQIMSDDIDDSYVDLSGEKMTFTLKVGSYYWNGIIWSTTRSTFRAPMVGKGMDFDIPIDSHLSGQVQLEIHAGVTVGANVNTLYEVIFNSLEVTFVYNIDYTDSSRGENHYFQILQTNFRDEINVNLELASDMNNVPSPSVLMNDPTTPMSNYQFWLSQSFYWSKRPEEELLERLAHYYQYVRTKLELEAQHPEGTGYAALPLLKFNGIGDGKIYLPLSEDRDWRLEKSTITCFETPT
jgi:hypothetical protein